jgi:excisionase family DNA binding protein
MPRKKSIPAVTTSSAVTPNEPLLVPLSEAARLLGTKIYSIRLLCRKGALPFRIVGNRWLVNYQALKKFAEGSANGRAA